MQVQAPHIANLLSYASYCGVSEKVLRDFLIDKNQDVCNPYNSVSENEFLMIFEKLMHSTSDRYFGLHYGCYLNIKAVGFIAQLSLNTSSIRQAILILQNYFQNSLPLVSLEVVEGKGKFILRLESIIEETTLRNQVLDVVYCFLYRELKLMVSNDLLPTLKIPYSNTSEYSKFLNVEVNKGVCYSFVFCIDILDAQINIKTASEIEVLLPKFLQMLDKKKLGYKSFSLQVRNMVLNMCCPELPTFDQVAVHFPLSNRTTQRKLTQEGLSFRKITDDIKNELSTYLSNGNKMKTQDIAYILGYSEPSAYLHAVKKWKTEFQS